MRLMRQPLGGLPRPSRLKVLAGISSLSGVNSGLGGHYRSFATIIAALSHSVDMYAFHLGNMAAPPLGRLAELPTVRVERIFATRGMMTHGYLRLRSSVRRLIAHDDNRAVLVSFDLTSGHLMEALADDLGLPHVNVKPGGPFPPWFPEFSNQIVFHQDDLRHLVERGQRHGHVITNRIDASPSAPERAELLRQRAQPTDLLILRIARFSRAHVFSYQVTSSLTRTLQSRGLAARAVFIGAPQKRAIVAHVMADAPAGTLLLTEPNFTHDASDFIPAAALVVGMGRSAMEPLAFGTPTAVPVAGLSHPVLVTPERFSAFLNDNFTHRVTREALGAVDDQAAADEIAATLSSPAASDSLHSAVSPMVVEHLGALNAPAKYLAVLEGLQEHPRDRSAAALRVLRLDARYHLDLTQRGMRAGYEALKRLLAPRSRDS
jgi:hypothetical protein